MTLHRYDVDLEWCGNLGHGTTSYKSYQRDFKIQHPSKPFILGSADPAYLGNPQRWNPEDLILASASACHQLWYLHLCAVHGVVVLAYTDHATAFMQDQDVERRGHITEMTLKPVVTVQQGTDLEQAQKLHIQAHHECMIANSVNFPIYCHAQIIEQVP
ncbi:OsmC family protein [Acinetobacter sp. B10A]|uniref:OsmC family protein n=1 Tax=Acinetobacter baretiae TaxID=2605383 RepID=UPI001B3C67BB|nr:OsmC family protein [Acinetobacter baretiae]MBF7684817.1 OsmC family protein [Acinetobacter baretiae]